MLVLQKIRQLYKIFINHIRQIFIIKFLFVFSEVLFDERLYFRLIHDTIAIDIDIFNMIKIKIESIFYPTTEYKHTNKMSNQQQTEEKNVTDGDKEQYKKICDEEECDTILDIDTPIMCYMNEERGDKTL